MSPPLPRSVLRGRRVVVGLLVVSALTGLVTVAWALVLLVELVVETLPFMEALL
jgi:hypothetical protein